MTSIDVQLPKHVLAAIKERRFSSCLEELPRLAEKGSVEAKIALVHAYFHGGDGVQRNYEVARYWLEKISAEDDVTGYAAYRLGLIYCKGLSVSTDDRLAFRYFRRAASRGNSKSLLMVAILQKKGDGTLKKPHSATVIFHCCAKNRELNIFMRLLAGWLSLTLAKANKGANKGEQRGRR